MNPGESAKNGIECCLRKCQGTE